MITKARPRTSHAFFAPTGFAYTSPSAGTVSRTTLPPAAAADGSGLPAWFSLGILESMTENAANGSVIEIRKPNPGVKHLYQEIGVNPNKQLTLTCKEIHALSYQLLKGSLTLTRDPAATAIQYNHLEGQLIVEGWLKTQTYDASTNEFVEVQNIYGGIRFEGEDTLNGEGVDYTLTFKVWLAAGNSGVIMPV